MTTYSQNYRSSDPYTSSWGIEDFAPRRNSQMLRILDAYSVAGVVGLTAYEAGVEANLLKVGYWKRVSDLTRLGYIEPRTVSTELEDVETRVNPKSGSRQVVLCITEAGREHLRRNWK